MSETQTLTKEIAALRKEVVALRKQIDEVDDWANGIHMAVSDLMFVLLRDHPKAQQVADQLKQSYDRYLELQAHPRRRTRDEPAVGIYESRKLLYAGLACFGLWPDVDPHQWAEQSLSRFQQQT